MNYPKRLFFLHHKWYIALLEVISGLIALVALIVVLNPDEQKINIAAVIPQNLDKKNTGKSIEEALDIYAERINKYGGINGKKLKITFYDDQGSIKKAQDIANTIVKENKVVAVIGHFSDNTTQAAGEIYHNAGIPIISPISNIKPDKQWRFQLSPTRESYGIYMAHYIKNALDKNNITIIRSDEHNDKQLIDAFQKKFTALEGNINKVFEINSKSSDVDISQIIEELQNKIKNKIVNKGSMLLISSPEEQAIPLIIALKKSHIDLNIMLSNGSTLIDKFNHMREERLHSGYYSNGIHTPAILLKDGINTPSLALVRKDYEIRHANRIRISNTAMTATLAAMPLVHILGLAQFSQIEDISTTRTKLKNFLQNFTWYDKEQIGRESILLFGLYKNNTLITAPINPIVINNGDVSNIEKERSKGKILSINNTNLYMTNFVYTGVSMKKISHINLSNLNYTLDFYLWFRYKQGMKHADDIEFINTKGPIKLFELLQESKKPPKKNEASEQQVKPTFARLVESQVLNGEVYRRYHIRANFRTHKQKNYTVGQQNLYIRFRNNKKNTFQLRYLTDSNNSHQGVFHPEADKKNYNLIEHQDLKLNYNFEYISTSHKTALGNPNDLNRSSRFSEFIAEYRIEYTLWSFRGLASWVNKKLSGREDQINTALMLVLVLISFTIFNFTRYIQRNNSLLGIPNYLWLLQLSTIFLILLFGEFALSQVIFDLKYSEWGEQNRTEIEILMRYTGYIIATLWWVIPAYYIASAVDQFLWKPIQHNTGTKIPAVLHLFIVIIIYIIALLGIMAFVFEITVTGMAATSGVIALMFAVASKVDLSNIIAGLGISFSKTFNLGDWVKINDSIEGKVIELSPRSTNILTTDSSIISIPNTTVANATIKNYNRPNKNFRLTITVETLATFQINFVEKILVDSLLISDDILKNPEPIIHFKGESSNGNQLYKIIFYVSNYENRYAIQQIAWRNIWNELDRRKLILSSHSELNLAKDIPS